MTRVAVLDDYQSVALEMADWSRLPDGVDIVVFNDHLSDLEAVGQRLRNSTSSARCASARPFPATSSRICRI